MCQEAKAKDRCGCFSRDCHLRQRTIVICGNARFVICGNESALLVVLSLIGDRLSASTTSSTHHRLPVWGASRCRWLPYLTKGMCATPRHANGTRWSTSVKVNACATRQECPDGIADCSPRSATGARQRAGAKRRGCFVHIPCATPCFRFTTCFFTLLIGVSVLPFAGAWRVQDVVSTHAGAWRVRDVVSTHAGARRVRDNDAGARRCRPPDCSAPSTRAQKRRARTRHASVVRCDRAVRQCGRVWPVTMALVPSGRSWWSCCCSCCFCSLPSDWFSAKCAWLFLPVLGVHKKLPRRLNDKCSLLAHYCPQVALCFPT